MLTSTVTGAVRSITSMAVEAFILTIRRAICWNSSRDLAGRRRSGGQTRTKCRTEKHTTALIPYARNARTPRDRGAVLGLEHREDGAASPRRSRSMARPLSSAAEEFAEHLGEDGVRQDDRHGPRSFSLTATAA
jgi:hypothetical protein